MSFGLIFVALLYFGGARKEVIFNFPDLWKCPFWEFAVFTVPIIHLVYPPKFILGFTMTYNHPKRLETMLVQKFWGVNKMHYGSVKKANKENSGALGPVVQSMIKLIQD